MYEASNVEPVAYKVTGSFGVIRYVADAGEHAGSSPDKVDPRGNGVGAWGTQTSGQGFLKDTISRVKKMLLTPRTDESLNPQALETASGFTIEVYQKFDGDVLPVARIRECRITTADFRMSKRNPTLQRFNFTALYVDEDSFLADFSNTIAKYA
jgi:hypothetical protein